MTKPEQLKRKKLIKVLEFYRNQSDVLVEKSRKLGSRVTQLQHRSGELIHEMEQQEVNFVTLAATPTNRMLAHQTLQQLAEQKRLNQIELHSANEKFELNRAELMALMARIESIEKLIEQLASSISLEQRKQEQINADERYLSTHFGNRSLT